VPVVHSTPSARTKLSEPAGCDQLSLLAAQLAAAQHAVKREVVRLLPMATAGQTSAVPSACPGKVHGSGMDDS